MLQNVFRMSQKSLQLPLIGCKAESFSSKLQDRQLLEKKIYMYTLGLGGVLPEKMQALLTDFSQKDWQIRWK